MKKWISMVMIIAAMACAASAADKKDSATVKSNAFTQPIASQPLAKQTQIVYKAQSNWSKIKELFR